MYLVVASKEDTASMNITGVLLKMADWKEEGEFEGNPVLRLSDRAALVTINDSHLYHDHVDRKVSEATGLPMPETVIFLSRHKSESGLRTLTVHPLGCYGTADYGGRDGTLVPSAPGPMTRALRLVRDRAKEKELDFKVSYECTHHGPYLETPTFFIEIGSSEEVWGERPPAEVLAGSVLTVMRNDDDTSPVAIGVGGGHYAPRITDVAIANRIYFGHMVPSYALKGATDEVLTQAAERTPGAKMVYFHRKALKGGQLKRLKELFTGLGLEAVREKDLEDI